MELREYCDKCNKLADQKRWDDLSDFQYEYMNNVLSEYGKVVQETKDPLIKEARTVIYDVMHYAVYRSETGSSLYYLSIDKELVADKIDDIIQQDIGDYLLDYMIYDENEKWVVDCMFGGCFVPDWDGWED